MLDRAAHRRTDRAWLEAQLESDSTRFVPVWRNRNLVTEGRPPEPRFVTLGEVESLLNRAEAPVFLGVERTGDEPEQALFALDLTSIDESELGLESFKDLRRAGAFMPQQSFRLLAYARGICRWHRQAKHCQRCGANAMSAVEAGFARLCSSCDTKVFPRTDPAVMVLIVRGDYALLARQPAFPPGMYSALAGFVEPGESLEECVRRETLEEVGLEVTELRYADSQPWPFPSSLMLGFICSSTSEEITLDNEELEEARWFHRSELKSPKGFFYPPPMSLAYDLIQAFLGNAESNS